MMVLKEQITQRFGQPGLMVEGLRLKEAHQYSEQVIDHQPNGG